MVPAFLCLIANVATHNPRYSSVLLCLPLTVTQFFSAHPTGRNQPRAHENTIVLFPWTRMRSSTCQATARASKARSV